MDKRALLFIEESFLKPLLEMDDITDISYNGKDIYYFHNQLGRQKSDIKISNDDAKAFLRHLANICEQQFSYSSPYLDISLGKYRLNATFSSIARMNNEKVFTFSIRVASNEIKIVPNSEFLSDNLVSLFKVLIDNKISIVIGGVTGTGKTEFQKYLISSLDSKTRVIIIDNVLELDSIGAFSHLDLNIWQSDDKNGSSNIQNLVKNALRNNPDWIIVAESRGSEMIEILNSAMTGHPIITTIHSYDAKSIPNRMSRMVMMNDKKMDYKDVYYDICHHFPICVYLDRKIKKGKVIRCIKEIMEISPNGDSNTIYLNDGKNKKYYSLKFELKDRLVDVEDKVFKKIFLEGENS